MKYLSKDWLNLKKSRIGSSEIFGLVQYYATNQELLNCGIDPLEFKQEKSFTSAFFLYHKIIGTSGLYNPSLPISLGEYGLSAECYAKQVLKEQGTDTKKQEMFITDYCIATCDLVTLDKQEIIEVKTVNKFARVEGMSWRTNIQHQFQMWLSGAKKGRIFEILLKNDNNELRCYLAGLYAGSKKKFIKLMKSSCEFNIYEDNYNPAIGELIKDCITRFFNDVKLRNEPDLKIIFADDKKKILLEKHLILKEKEEVNIDLKAYLLYKKSYEELKNKFDDCKKSLVDTMYEKDSITAIDSNLKIQIKMDSRGGLREKQIKGV